MKKIIILCFWGLIITISCKTESSSQKEIIGTANEVVKDEQNSNEMFVEKIPISELGESQLLEIESKSSFNIGLLSVYGHSMSFCSNSNLTYYLLGYSLSENTLRSKYGAELLKIVEELEFNDTIQIVNKYIVNNSFFKIHYDQSKDIYRLACASIKNPEIKILYGINIGMKKEDFFAKLFEESKDVDFSKIDTVLNGSEDGGISQYYLFKNDTLSDIVVNSVMDWIPCEVEMEKFD